MPTPGPTAWQRRKAAPAMRLGAAHRRLVRGAAAARRRRSRRRWRTRSRARPRAGSTSSAAPRSTVFILQIVTGILLAFVYVPSAGEAWNSLQVLNHEVSAGLVHPRPARLGLELHGRHRAHPHGAGLPLRRVQVSARADLDRRRLPAAHDARHGVHRPGAALRSGRLLGTRHRRVDLEPDPAHRAGARQAAARRPDHRRRDAVALLRAARLRHSRAAHRLRRRASAAGAEARHQRVADARARSSAARPT